METRLGGQDGRARALNDDGEESYAPIAYLADANAEPGRVLEHAQEEAAAQRRADQRTRESRSAQPPHYQTRWLKEKDQAPCTTWPRSSGCRRAHSPDEVKAMQKMRSHLSAPAARTLIRAGAVRASAAAGCRAAFSGRPAHSCKQAQAPRRIVNVSSAE